MEPAVITLATFASSTAMSILAFMVGRCGRKLPIDRMLPRVVYSARFSPEKDGPRLVPEPARPNWPHADQTSCQQRPRLADARPPQNSKLCATMDATELMLKARISTDLDRQPAISLNH